MLKKDKVTSMELKIEAFCAATTLNAQGPALLLFF